jgi:hypothetical protein
MLAMRTTLPDLTRLGQDGLKAMILAQHEQLQIKDEQRFSREQEIAHLKLLLAKLRRMQFGQKWEKGAVKTQIWIAVSVYVLVAIVRKRLGLEASLYEILQILSVTLFEKTPSYTGTSGPRLSIRFTRSR